MNPDEPLAGARERLQEWRKREAQCRAFIEAYTGVYDDAWVSRANFWDERLAFAQARVAELETHIAKLEAV